MKILWALVSIVVFGLVLRFVRVAANKSPDLAATAAFSGELAVARALVAERLQANERDAAALFVLACVCLQEGDFTGARSAAQRFGLARSNAPELLVLTALIDAREATPSASWAEPFVQAVRRMAESATPPLYLADARTPQAPITEAQLAPLAPADRLLVEYASSAGPPSESLTRLALALSSSPESIASVPLGLTTYVVLNRSKHLEPEVRRAAAATLIQGLAKMHARTRFLALLAALDGTSTESPMSFDEATRLNEIINEDEGFEEPASQIYGDFKRAIGLVLPTQAADLAFAAFSGIAPGTLPGRVLIKRVTATQTVGSVETRSLLGHALVTLGRRLVHSPTVLDVALGRMYLARAAELTAEQSVQVEANAASATFDDLLSRAEILRFTASWPIAPLQAELRGLQVTDEVGLLRRLH